MCDVSRSSFQREIDSGRVTASLDYLEKGMRSIPRDPHSVLRDTSILNCVAPTYA